MSYPTPRTTCRIRCMGDDAQPRARYHRDHALSNIHRDKAFPGNILTRNDPASNTVDLSIRDQPRNVLPLQLTIHNTLSGSLGAIVGYLKSATARRINRIRHRPGTGIWQRNYYEHIIRSEKVWERIREYIVNNPLQWDLDIENPANWDVDAVNADCYYRSIQGGE